ncbi:uncharacterized protein LOC110686657 [Chenopodium quinoa]|uniref:uncharacterized protein LOC110686657 n=1 Tax=Chenopodium quinoa TaxID=63459 RepID=UPI000B77871E|nr:uncharacterized protein LOC110686657 [Chenopodium quinoa]
MLGYSKFAVFAFLMLTASAVIDAKFQPIIRSSTTPKIMTQELLEAEVKALASLREAEQAIALNLKQKLYTNGLDCFPLGSICSGFGPPDQCCSGACVPHPIKRIFYCDEIKGV